ncbi:hypothetical protein HY478_01335 [Candidatus Uhrbacteria bacterium]|nr:hypothetical protein [Candidatus Uhrbacteria bacterium]
MSIFDPSRWFTLRPPELSFAALKFFGVAALLFLIIGIVLVLAGGRLRARDPHLARGERRLGAWFITWPVVFLTWLFFAYERINFLGAPFWVLIALLAALVWLFSIIWYYVRTLPGIRARDALRQDREQYLPKKKL